MSVAVAILGLAFLVLIHEGGHFAIALAVRMRPRKFYVGFPPAIAKFTHKVIEYGLGAIPLGGYVRIPGMHRPAPSDLEAHFHRALKEEPKLLAPLERTKRALETSDLEGARADVGALREALEQAELSPGPGHAAQRGLTDLEDALAPDAYWRQRAWRKIAVIFAGPATNLVFAVVIFAIVFMIGGGKAIPVVNEVIAGNPAAAAGLRPGDRILKIDGKPVTTVEIPQRISGSEGRPLTLTVRRGGKELVIGPVSAVKQDDGIYRIGFSLRTEGLSAGAASWKSIRVTGVVSREIAKSLGRLAHGEGRKQISSPVGIVRESSKVAKQGALDYLLVLGFISLSLALLNLLPLLPLDGGHIAFSIVEGVRGRAVGREIYERVSAVGLVLVLLLFFVGLSNDVGNFGGG